MAIGEDGRPSWDSAPEWAQWLAMDENGVWHWYEKEPEIVDFVWDIAGRETHMLDDGYRVERAFDNPEWKDSLESRPE